MFDLSGRTKTVRAWLRENHYGDIADVIDELMLEWKRQGKKTRRNWWGVLAGGVNGKPRKVNGVTFPVLKAAQIRQGLPVTANALCRNKHEKPPEIARTNRWPMEQSRQEKNE